MPAGERQRLAEAAAKEVEWVKQSQELFLKVRAVMARQAQHTLAHDELSMCCARHALHGDGGGSSNAMRAGLYLHRAEARSRRAYGLPGFVRGGVLALERLQ